MTNFPLHYQFSCASILMNAPSSSAHFHAARVCEFTSLLLSLVNSQSAPPTILMPAQTVLIVSISSKLGAASISGSSVPHCGNGATESIESTFATTSFEMNEIKRTSNLPPSGCCKVFSRLLLVVLLLILITWQVHPEVLAAKAGGYFANVFVLPRLLQ